MATIRNPIEWGAEQLRHATSHVESSGRSIRGHDAHPAVRRIGLGDLRDALGKGLDVDVGGKVALRIAGRAYGLELEPSRRVRSQVAEEAGVLAVSPLAADVRSAVRVPASRVGLVDVDEDSGGRAAVGVGQRADDLEPASGLFRRRDADARAYGLQATLEPLRGVDWRTLMAIGGGGDPKLMIALAFRELAENAGKIGELNVTPDLLRSLLSPAQGK